LIPVLDAHHHLWDLRERRYPWLQDQPPTDFRYGDTRPLRKHYLPADFLADAQPCGVLKSVHVEAEWDPLDPVGETRWVTGLAARHGFPHALVAQAWLDRDDVENVLAAQASFALARGVRHKPEVGAMRSARWRRGYALLQRHGLHFELQAPWRELYDAADLASAFSRTTLVLNHAGLPADRSPEGLAGWRAAMRALADCPNAVVKISGLGIAGRPWRVADQVTVVLEAIAIFGARRCMFASNFPVEGLVGSYATIMNGFREIVAGLPRPDQRALLWENAHRVYRIDGA
jgi:predicted TIM-barrel fold metal-dependent hydrolase